jgi:hypothetical protein
LDDGCFVVVDDQRLGGLVQVVAEGGATAEPLAAGGLALEPGGGPWVSIGSVADFSATPACSSCSTTLINPTMERERRSMR